MAIPSGSGTEVLKASSINGNSDAWTNLITGVANHIYTVLSITAFEATGTDETIYIRIDGTIYILQATLPATGTFVWNDKFVISGAKDLTVYNTAGAVDWHCSYIDQDWT